jgi:hypothetical protein
MKKIHTLMKYNILFAAFLFNLFSLNAQCPGCQINPTCYVPGGGLCPDSLPAATVLQSYSQDITFYLPKTIDATSFSGGLLGVVPLVELRIDAISGLPFGLNWSCNMPTNNCTYFPSANDTLGCVKVCGVPIGNPGLYNLTIFVTATVNAGILGNQTAQTSFASQMLLLPDTSTNPGFTMAPSFGCEPLLVSFINNNPSGNYSPIPGQTQGYVYAWDFGNGLQSNAENPPPVTFSSGGSFPVNYYVRIDTFGFTLTNIAISNVACTDFLNDPDIYIRIFNGSNTLVFNTANNPTTWAPGGSPLVYNLNIPANNPPYRIEVWDDDSGFLGTADDNCFDGSENPHPLVTLPLPPVGNLGNTTQAVAGQLSFTFTYSKNAIEIIAADTVTVFPRPPSSSYSVSPASTVCAPDSVLLTLPPGFGYEWFRNDSILLTGVTGNSTYVKLGGTYKTRMFDLNTGCDRFSIDTLISIADSIPQNFSLNSDGTTLFSNLGPGNYTYQWRFWDGATFLNIPPPQGAAPTYTPPVAGLYQLEVSSNGICTAQATFQFQPGVGIESISNIVANLFPNPTSNNFVSLALSEYISPQAITVLDINNRIVFIMNNPERAESGNFIIPTQNLNTGIYLVKIDIPNHNIMLKLLVNH